MKWDCSRGCKVSSDRSGQHSQPLIKKKVISCMRHTCHSFICMDHVFNRRDESCPMILHEHIHILYVLHNHSHASYNSLICLLCLATWGAFATAIRKTMIISTHHIFNMCEMTLSYLCVTRPYTCLTYTTHS